MDCHWGTIAVAVTAAILVGSVSVATAVSPAGAQVPHGAEPGDARTPLPSSPGASPSAEGVNLSSLQPNGTNLSPDSRSIRIRVLPNGTAIWVIERRIQLEDDNESAAFDALERRIERDPLRFTGPLAEAMQDAAAVASEETGRDMRIERVTVTARTLPNDFGVVTYRFTWTNFAAVDGGTVRAGDEGFVPFLESEDSTLIVEWPDDYAMESVAPEPDERRADSNTLVWRGPITFGSNEPRVVLTGGGLLRSLPVVPIVALLALVALAGVGVAGWRYRDQMAGESATDDTAAGSADDGPDPEPPQELLSDEERVIRLLEDNGGRMKQQDVVTTLEWSETKTSQVVNDLQEAEKIEVYRIGRENVLSLPGEMDV
jgi:hypothetical protein